MRYKDFSRSESGAVLIEFAAVVTVLLILIFPTIDFARYILLQQKVIKTSHSIGDSIAMSQPIEPSTTAAEITAEHMTLNALQAIVAGNVVDSLMSPFPPEGSGGQNRYQVVVTHVFNSGGVPTISWQFDLDSGTLNSGAASITGSGRGSPAALPVSLSNGFGGLDPSENAIVVEASALYQPITPGLQALGVPFLAPTMVTHNSYFPGRYGQLGCIWQIYMPPVDC